MLDDTMTSEADLPQVTRDATARPAADQTALRQIVRDIAAAEAKSIVALSAEAGVPNGTFSNWLNGTYAGDNDRVAAKVRIWLDARPTRERLRAQMPADPAYVETGDAAMIVATLEHAQYLPDFALVVAVPGFGKTTAAAHYRANHANVWKITGEPCATNPRAMLEMIAEEMRIGTSGVSAMKMSSQIVRRMRASSGLLIVDEAQHFSSAAFDQLRTLFDLAQCGIVAMGNETINARLTGGGGQHFAQLTSRVGMRFYRARCSPASISALIEAWGIHDGTMRSTLQAIATKPGALRVMGRTLRLAHRLALGEEAGGLRLDHITAAYRTVSNERDAGAVA